MNCSHCGSPVSASDRHCPACGAEINSAPVSTATSARAASAPSSDGERSTGGLVVALTCPVCGANAKPTDERCDFCGAYMVIMTDLPRIDPKSLNQAVINQHIAEFRADIRKDTEDAAAHYGLGVAYFNLGLLEESAVELEEAVRLMPENPNIQVQLATVYSNLDAIGEAGYHRKAVDRVKRSLLLRPNMPEALMVRASMSLREGNAKAAIADWSTAAVERPDSIRQPISSYLRANEDLLATAPFLQPAGKPAKKPGDEESFVQRRKALLLGLVASLGLCLLGFVLGQLAPTDATGASTGALASVSVALMAIAVIAGPIVWFITKRRMAAIPKSVVSLDAPVMTPEEVKRMDLVDGSAPPDELLVAANYVADTEILRKEMAAKAEAELAAAELVGATAGANGKKKK